MWKVDNEEELIEMPNSLKDEIISHLKALQEQMINYFNISEITVKGWIRNPFTVCLGSIDDTDVVENDLIEIRASAIMQQNFNAISPLEFWCSLINSYPSMSKRALTKLIPFATTYLCKAGFSILVAIKTKNRNRLNIKHDMRIALSKTPPQVDVLLSRKRQRISSP